MKYLVVLLALVLGACSEPAAEPGVKALVGGRLEASLDAAPVEYSVVVIAGGKIRAAGTQAEVPVPKGSETINAKGMVIRPMPYTAAIKEGEPANLMVSDAETGEPQGIMSNGEWVR
jgi:hypothetical protein